MPVARKCSFCGGRVEPGSGLMFVKRDGSILFFCSSKCRRNFSLGRKPAHLKWTQRSKSGGKG
ncbi:50S ribosomal protein L24e [Candidatus Hadarchaeum sp.]|uniref:50S ribosomal protein L24e n=1 Tax=Candidatus Hadarchaeum sp. TaxID=2883567 RepID=UPI00319E538C